MIRVELTSRNAVGSQERRALKVPCAQHVTYTTLSRPASHPTLLLMGVRVSRGTGQTVRNSYPVKTPALHL